MSVNSILKKIMWINRGSSSQTGELGHKGPLKNSALSLVKLGNRASEPSDDMKKMFFLV